MSISMHDCGITISEQRHKKILKKQAVWLIHCFWTYFGMVAMMMD